MEPATTIHEIRNNYASLLAIHRGEENALCEKILTKERQLQGLEEKRKLLAHNYPYWTEQLLRPVLEQLKPAFPEWSCDDKSITPLGMKHKVAVFFCKNDELAYAEKYADDNSVYICFSPGDLQAGELLYETGDNVSKPVESLDELINFLKSQIIENGIQ